MVWAETQAPKLRYVLPVPTPIWSLSGSAESAYHFAATLATLRGVVESRYDWSMRPLFLRFSTSDRAERRAALLALCEAIGEDGPARLVQAEQHALSREPDHL